MKIRYSNLVYVAVALVFAACFLGVLVSRSQIGIENSVPTAAKDAIRGKQPLDDGNLTIAAGLRFIESDIKKFDKQCLNRIESLHYNDCNREQIDQLWEFTSEMQYCINIPVEDRMTFIIDHFPISLIDDVADNMIRISSIDELQRITSLILSLNPGEHRADIFYLILQRMVKLEVAENDYETLFGQVEPDEATILRKDLETTKNMSKQTNDK